MICIVVTWSDGLGEMYNLRQSAMTALIEVVDDALVASFWVSLEEEKEQRRTHIV